MNRDKLMRCLFCQIVNKQRHADVIYEDRNFVVFKNIRPVAPVHLLIIPKRHIPSVQHLQAKDRELIGELFLLAAKLAKKQGRDKKGYKLVFNVGKGGGQMVKHLHLHFLAGWRSAKERDIPGMP